jgi:hypothetical protein
MAGGKRRGAELRNSTISVPLSRRRGLPVLPEERAPDLQPDLQEAYSGSKPDAAGATTETNTKGSLPLL